MTNQIVRAITDADMSALRRLAEEASREGWSFVERAVREYESGANTFAQPGERFWGVFQEGECIAIGGLNRDPYLEDETVGRVRHLYVSERFRRQGLAKKLMEIIINEARLRFTVLRLGTKNPVAAAFYESLGFKRQEGPKVTHMLRLR